MKTKLETNERSGEAESLCIRIVTFSLLILIINFWSLHHLGNNLTQFLIANGPLVLIAIINFFTQILKNEESSTITEKIRTWFFFFLKTPILIILFGAISVAGSVVSSVTVMSSGVSDKMAVHLTPEGQTEPEQRLQELNGPNDVIRLIEFTTPFGRAFYLEIEGYLRYSFDLYPWIGKKIRVARDLSISPSVLIRVPVATQLALSRGKVVVLSGKSIIAEAKTNARQGSVIVGHNVAIPSTFVEKWKRELTADGIAGRAAARSILAWQQPIVVRSSEQLLAGKTIEARFIVNENTVMGKTKYQIGLEKIQDILMLVEEVNQ